MAFRTWLVLPIACASLIAGEANSAIAALMRRTGEGPRHLKVLLRTPADGTLDLVVALGMERSAWPPGADGGWWDQNSRLGLFLQRREQPGMIYQISVTPGGALSECYARVVRATASQVVVSCTPSKGSGGPNWKFLYDVRAKSLVRQFAYDRIPLHHVSVSGGRAVLTGTGPGQPVSVDYDPGREVSFLVRKGPKAAAARRPERRVVPFSPRSPLALVIDSAGITVEDRAAPSRVVYSLPKSSYDEFAAVRPLHVKNGHPREHTRISESIGPWQLIEGTAWFAKCFYDGEGDTGVGGFGYFDTTARRFRIYAPPEIVDWSAPAILVEQDSVWLGLEHRGEYESIGGGLLRFDRATETVQIHKLRDVISGIARLGDRLVMATDFGLAVLEGQRIRRYFVDRSSAGEPIIVEASIEH